MGCPRSRAACRASLRARAIRCAVSLASIGASGSVISFSATSQANSLSYAHHTRPMAPAPSVRSSR
ncbi:hypothetical protein POF73_27860 [Streptomyces sp. HD]|nr:hypothetical protein [Streptomyces sp. HD]MDC0770674.1 hypothetical protein [Streptomyces sp. HD]